MDSYEPLYVAVRALATDADTIQSRLHSAFALHTLTVADFPTQELRDEFTSIVAALTCVPAEADEGTAQATAQRLTDDEAREVAREIFDLFIKIARLHMRDPS